MSNHPIHLIFGSDEYLVSDKVKALLKESLSPNGNAAMPCERMDGAVDKVDGAITAVRNTLTALNAMDLFCEHKIVLLENATFFADSRTAQSPAVQDEIARLTAKIKSGLPPGVTLIISATGMDKRRAFYKACNAVGSVQEFSVLEDKPSNHNAIDARLVELLRSKGLTMETAAKEAFQQKVGLDTRLVLNEIEKLAVALGNRTHVSVGDIADFVSSSREAAFWDLADAFGRRDLPGSLRILRQLIFQRQNMIGLISNLEKRIRDLLIYREGLDRKWILPKRTYGNAGFAWADLPPEAELTFTAELENDPRSTHPYRASLLATQAAGFTRKRLEHCLRQITQAHENMVSSRVPPELIMEILLVRTLGTVRRQPRNVATQTS